MVGSKMAVYRRAESSATFAVGDHRRREAFVPVRSAESDILQAMLAKRKPEQKSRRRTLATPAISPIATVAGHLARAAAIILLAFCAACSRIGGDSGFGNRLVPAACVAEAAPWILGDAARASDAEVTAA